MTARTAHRTLIKSSAALSALALYLAAPGALAAEPHTANSIQLGIGSRYGVSLEEGFNPWGFGLGIEGGYTLPSALYLGGNFEYFFGEDPDATNLWQIMAEAGYDLAPTDNFVIRPKAGVGPVFFDGSPSGTYFGVAPGATFIWALSSVTLVLDGRYELVFAEGEVVEGVIFSVGIGF